VRFVLAAAIGLRARAEDRRLAAGPATTGAVVLGQAHASSSSSPTTPFVFYVMSVLNTARTAVDIGGPLTFELPRRPWGGLVKTLRRKPQSTDHADVVTSVAPGIRRESRFELAATGPWLASNSWPAPLQQVEAFALKTVI
jgi:hypothetical protein